MWSSLRVAAAGMMAHQRSMDVAGSNLSNINTVGYKTRRANLADVPPQELTVGVPTEDGGVTLEQREVGMGARLNGVLTNQTPGPLLTTGRPLDIAILGQGYIPISMADGSVGFTRDGSLQIDGGGRLITTSGALVEPAITMPPNHRDLSIDRSGTVTARSNETDELVTLGQIRLVRFANPDGLESIAKNVVAASEASGDPILLTPGVDAVELAPASLEGSNVNTAEEYVRVLTAQRAYQLNVRALKTIDEMLQVASNLRR